LVVGIAINKAWNIYNFRQGIIKALIGQGHTVVAIAPQDAYVTRLEELGCIHEHLPLTDTGSNPFSEIKAIVAFYGIIKRHKIDVLLNYTIKCNLYGTMAASWAGVPAICNISGLGTAFLADGLSSRVARLLSKYILRGASHMFFQNADDQKDFMDATGLSAVPHSLLPGSGINLERFVASRRKIPNTYQFLLLARLIIEKGVKEFAEAAKIVKKNYPEARFLVVGSFDENHSRSIKPDQLEQWIEEGRIEYLAHRDDIISLINESEVVVLPSYREGTPRSLLEAASCSRPLITTNVPGCREVVNDHINGFLCEVRSAEDLAKKCFTYLGLSETKKLEMGSASRALVEQKFDEKIVIKAYMDKILELT
jgi:glycosyltransferase involved in cell wall biosynthesis